MRWLRRDGQTLGEYVIVLTAIAVAAAVVYAALGTQILAVVASVQAVFP